jgi:hypothetical protein
MSGPAAEFDPTSEPPRFIAEVRNYWAGKCSGDRLPSRADIRPSELKSWLPHVLLVDAVNDSTDFLYRLVGTRIARDFTASPTGRLMSEALQPFGDETVASTIATYRRVVTTRAPLRIRGSGAIYGQRSKFFDAVLMPLSDDGETVNRVFGGFFFEWDHDSAYDYVPGKTLPLSARG